MINIILGLGAQKCCKLVGRAVVRCNSPTPTYTYSRQCTHQFFSAALQGNRRTARTELCGNAKRQMASACDAFRCKRRTQSFLLTAVWSAIHIPKQHAHPA